MFDRKMSEIFICREIKWQKLLDTLIKVSRPNSSKFSLKVEVGKFFRWKVRCCRKTCALAKNLFFSQLWDWFLSKGGSTGCHCLHHDFYKLSCSCKPGSPSLMAKMMVKKGGDYGLSTGVSRNSRSHPFPGIPASNSRSRQDETIVCSSGGNLI